MLIGTCIWRQTRKKLLNTATCGHVHTYTYQWYESLSLYRLMVKFKRSRSGNLFLYKLQVEGQLHKSIHFINKREIKKPQLSHHLLKNFLQYKANEAQKSSEKQCS